MVVACLRISIIYFPFGDVGTSIAGNTGKIVDQRQVGKRNRVAENHTQEAYVAMVSSSLHTGQNCTVHFEKQSQVATSPNNAVNGRNSDYQRKRGSRKRDVKG